LPKTIYGCEIKNLNPSGVSPGDTVTIEIIGDFANCGEFKRAGYIEPIGMDTLYFDNFEMLNDTVARVLAIFPDNLPYTETEFFICNTWYWDNRLGTILTIGSKTTVFKPDLCMVTTDTNSNNMIIWSPPSIYNIDSVLIYKETFVTDEFIPIGRVLADKLFFVDTLSAPAQISYRYQIIMKDNLGNSTLESDVHRTIHLLISAGIGGTWNLFWNKYEGFDYDSYKILRGTSDGKLSEIAYVPDNTFAYTDFKPPEETVYYQIEAVNPNPCTIDNLKSALVSYNSTRSNIASGLYILVNPETEGQISIWPNPAQNQIHFSLEKFEGTVDISILALDGKVLINKIVKGNSDTIDISSLKSGIYIVQLSNKDHLVFTKIIKH